MLKKLKELLTRKLARMEELSGKVVNEKGEVRKFTEDEQSEYSKLETEANEAKEAIKRAESLKEGQEVVRSLDRSTSESVSVQVTREDKHNEQGEFRGYKSIGKGGLGEFLKDIAAYAARGIQSDTLRQLRAATGASESVGADGGFLVQSDHAENLFTQAKDAGKIASRCTPVPMTTNSTTINLVDESSLAVGSQFGGVQAFWRAEAAQVTTSKPKFRQEAVRAEVLEALFYATEEQLEDAPQLETFANMAFSTAISYQLDDAVVSGSGAGKPLGVLNSGCLITIAKESGQAANTVKYENVDKMVDRMLVGSESNAVWYIHPDVRQQLRNAMWKPGTLTEYPVYLPQGGISGSQNDSLYGYPVERLQQCKALSSLGDIILADFSKYLLFVKRGIAASQSAHVAFLTSERVFKWNMRVNGMPIFNKAITDANGSNTRSPFVTLAAR
jgi:HK97 family phage major capsid protein